VAAVSNAEPDTSSTSATPASASSSASITAIREVTVDAWWIAVTALTPLGDVSNTCANYITGV
jgi:hypothetical protein